MARRESFELLAGAGPGWRSERREADPDVLPLQHQGDDVD